MQRAEFSEGEMMPTDIGFSALLSIGLKLAH